MSRRNPFFYEQIPEDCPVVKAFESNKHDIFKLLMKKPAKIGSHAYERIVQTLLFQAINRYDKQKPICQTLFKLLGENGSKGVVNRIKDGLLFINEAISKNDPGLVQEILYNLQPNVNLRDQSGTLGLTKDTQL